MQQNHLNGFTFGIAGAILGVLGAGSAHAAAVVSQERLPQNGSGGWNFSTISDPTNTDYANAGSGWGVTASTNDSPHPFSGPVSKDLDSPAPQATGQGSFDDPGNSVWFTSGSATILFDLKQVIPVGEFNSYSWHGAETRTGQRYTLYGSAAAVAPDTTSGLSAVQRGLDGWTSIAGVLSTNNENGNGSNPTNATNTVLWDEGGTGAQLGVSIHDNAGGPLGLYRYLLMDITSNAQGTFFGEVDITALPEPGAVGAIVVGSLALLGKRRKR